MSSPVASPNPASKQLSAKRHVDRKILKFSISVGAVTSALAGLVYILTLLPSVRDARDANINALTEISCTDRGCDAGNYTTDAYSERPSYVVDAETGFFFDFRDASDSPPAFRWLDFSRSDFVDRFRTPGSYPTPDGEMWRLYSRQARLDGRPVDILIGYAEDAPWKILKATAEQIPEVDKRLTDEASKIAGIVGRATASDFPLARNGPRISADGFAITDAQSGAVLEWHEWVPMFLPNSKPIPSSPLGLYLGGNGDCFVVLTNRASRVVAVNLVAVGNLWLYLVFGILIVFFATLVVRALSRRFLRNYFAFSQVKFVNLEEALIQGEGPHVEFKRGISADEHPGGSVDEELLKTIAAFANSGNGVIFIGVDNSANVTGLKLTVQQRDRLEQKIWQLVRNQIKPTPPIQITFNDIDGVTVVSIAVIHGEEPAYLLKGVIYMRRGSSDVQAQPEDIHKLIAEYAS